jgi:hypothetical protein
MSTEPPVSEDDRRLIVRVREYLAWLDTQPPSEWVTETLGLIRGTIRRKWYPNPRMMEFEQPVGEWRSEAVPGVRSSSGQAVGGPSLPGTQTGAATTGPWTFHRDPREACERYGLQPQAVPSTEGATWTEGQRGGTTAVPAESHTDTGVPGDPG